MSPGLLRTTWRRALALAVLGGTFLLAFPGVEARPSARTVAAPASLCFSRPSDGAWDYVPRGRIAVWYPQSDGNLKNKAATLADALAGAARRKLGFMPPAFSDEPADCGDGGTPAQLDFYLVKGLKSALRKKVDGHTYELDIDGVKGTSGFVEIEAGLDDLNFVCTGVHEYFHLLGVRFTGRADPKNYWWTEAAAVWAEHFFDADCPRPTQKANLFMAQYSRDDLPKIGDPYTSWLWPLWIEREAGGTGAIRRVFEELGAHPDSYEAYKAIPAATWDKELPRFALREFNKGIVNEFSRFKATDSQAKRDVVDMSLHGKPEREKTLKVSVEPGASVLVLAQVLDVNTRELMIDVSDFTRQYPRGAAVRVLQQPTLGPDPVARQEEWGDAAEANWTGVRKKTLCRDRMDADYQQVVLAFSNTDPGGNTIDAKIKLRSRFACPWAASFNLTETGSIVPTPGALGPGESSSASGSLLKKWVFKLEAKPEPTECKGAKKACLLMLGRRTEDVSWKETESSKTFSPDLQGPYIASSRAEASGRASFPVVEHPGAGELTPSALYQRMEWDPKAKVFKPVIGITLVTLRAPTFGDVPTGLVPAAVARSSAHRSWNCSDDLGSEVLERYDESNQHGLFHSTDSLGACDHNKIIEETRGKAGLLYFGGGDDDVHFPNHIGLAFCGELTPYTPMQSGVGGCLEFELDPYKGTWSATYEATSFEAEPPLAGAALGWGIGWDCSLSYLRTTPCSVTTDLHYNRWQTKRTFQYELKLVDSKP